MKMWKPPAVLAVVFSAWLLTTPARASAESHGVMRVEDNAGLFSSAGVNKAKESFEGTSFKAATHFTVVTFGKVPEAKRNDYELVKGDKSRKKSFMQDWAVELYKSKRETGILALVCMESGLVRVVTDRESDLHRHFGSDQCEHVAKIFVAGLLAGKGKKGVEATALHDAALMNSAEYVSSELKDTTIPEKSTHKTRNSGSGGNSIMSYVCIGIAVLLGLWLVVGIFRALTGSSGGGGGMMGGGGYGGGGGGGGFLSSMMGGMFGAAAGMWMYNHFLGGGMNDLSTSDYGGSSGGGDYDTGAGDVDGGASGGGDFGGSDNGGDWDGGGGDFGGGDAGGGDWGGGDVGGGGDFGGGDW